MVNMNREKGKSIKPSSKDVLIQIEALHQEDHCVDRQMSQGQNSKEQDSPRVRQTDRQTNIQTNKHPNKQTNKLSKETNTKPNWPKHTIE